MKPPNPRAPNSAYDVSVDPAPKNEVIDAEEDEEDRLRREAALASTYDPTITHSGKTDEELIAEREADTRLLVDVAIVAGVAIALADDQDERDGADPEIEPDAPTEPDEDDGGE